MFSFDDAVAIVESDFLAFEEVITVVEINRRRPSLLVLVLVACGSGIMSNEHSFLRQSLIGSFLSCLGVSPSEIVDILFHELPSLSHIFGQIKFFIDFARIIPKLHAVSPGSSKCPVSFSGMELEFVYFLARIECSDVSSTVFSNPVNAMAS